MPQHHDNSKPALGGAFTLSAIGNIYYFMIEDFGYMKPQMCLCMHLKPNGELVAAIDSKWRSPESGEGEQ